MIDYDKASLKNFLKENIIDKHEARSITGQSETAFNQAVLRGRIIPILKYGKGRGGINLFLREDIEIYKCNMKKNKDKVECNETN